MSRWYTERKQEFFYQEAKRRGYRARSAFKLLQMQNKFNLIHKGDVVVDLGAAPGGWSQIAQELVGPKGVVIGVDLQPIKPIKGVQFIQGDVADPQMLDKIRNLLNDHQVTVVLSDMSPDISGNYTVDHTRSIWLCEQSFTVAERLLKVGGHFVCKLFEGEDAKYFIENIRQQFQRVKQFTPQASRKSSSEIYIIGKSFKNK
jgi:23S rRNA (uridine2552-2'-O)-methyltransferase